MAPRIASQDGRARVALPQQSLPGSPSAGYGSGLESDTIWVENPLVDPLRIGCCIGTGMEANMSSKSSTASAAGVSTIGDVVSPWMEWIESGIEFFGCDENASDGRRRSVLGRALMLHHAVKAVVQDEPSMRVEEVPKDYAAMHDAFLEALLHEQINLAELNGLKPALLQRKDSVDSSVSNLSSGTSFGADDPPSRAKHPMKLSKRRRSIKIQTPPRPKHVAKVAPVTTDREVAKGAVRDFTMPLARSSSLSVDSASIASNSGSSHTARLSVNAEKVSLQQIADGEHLPPVSWIHPDMELQKDKGKGLPIGSAVCAKGLEACLDKLRQKMELVVQVAMGEDRKKSAKIKRKIAMITEETKMYTETRSMIELKLGFLSMQYGMLIRWETRRTHKAILCVMRKMCHESFYDKILSPPSSAVIKRGRGSGSFSSSVPAQPVRRLEPPPLVVRGQSGNQAVFQRKFGTEVLLVNPPYRIRPPKQFSPSILTVDINYAKGLSQKSKWTISLTFADQTEVAQLYWNPETCQFETRRVDRMKWELSPSITSFDLSALELRLYEQRRSLTGFSRHTASMTIPLGGLVAQPSTSEATSWRITLPCSHDEKNASITLSFIHQSEYAYWLYRELDARRRHEVDDGSYCSSLLDLDDDTADARAGKAVKLTKRRRTPTDDEENGYLWDWICGMC